MPKREIMVVNKKHGNYVWIRMDPDEQGWTYLDDKQILRIRQNLCPRADCACRKNLLAEDGPQYLIIEQTDNGRHRVRPKKEAQK